MEKDMSSPTTSEIMDCIHDRPEKIYLDDFDERLDSFRCCVLIVYDAVF